MAGSAEINCVDILRDFSAALAQEKDFPMVQVYGGVGTIALCNPATVQKPDEARVIAPKGKITLPVRRDSGELRDFDVGVLSNNQEDIAKVLALAELAVGGRLDVSVFGLKDAADVDEMVKSPGSKSATMWVADRYAPLGTQWPLNRGSVEAAKVLFPFAAPIDSELLETWVLEIEDFEAPIPAPGTTILNYLTRSVSGLRKKDATKLKEVADNVLVSQPETYEWMRDGPGNTQFELARILQTLNHSAKRPRTLEVGSSLSIEPLARDLRDHSFFLLASKQPEVAEKVLKKTMLRSRALKHLESIDWVRAFYQAHIETKSKFAASIVHNDRRGESGSAH